MNLVQIAARLNVSTTTLNKHDVHKMTDDELVLWLKEQAQKWEERSAKFLVMSNSALELAIDLEVS